MREVLVVRIERAFVLAQAIEGEPDVVEQPGPAADAIGALEVVERIGIAAGIERRPPRVEQALGFFGAVYVGWGCTRCLRTALRVRARAAPEQQCQDEPAPEHVRFLPTARETIADCADG